MKNRRFWEFRNATDDPDVGELLLYGPIAESTWWGDEVTPKQFKEDLDALGDVSEIRVYINSGGGDVFAGQAIHSILRRHSATITVYIDGLAASIASVVAMAGDTVIMPKNAMLMVHNPVAVVIAWMDAASSRKLADDLDKIRESIIAVYEGRTGLERERIIELLDAETWMTAEEALEDWFADEVEEAREIAASIGGGYLNINGQQFDLSRYRRVSSISARVPVLNGVVPDDVSRETAPEETPWSKLRLSDFTDESWDELDDAKKRRIAGHFAWTADMPPEKFGDLKLGHHRASDGAVVWRGVASAAARLDQTDIPDEDRPRVEAHLKSHYEQFDKEWPEDSTENATVTRRAITVEDVARWFDVPVEVLQEVIASNGGSEEPEEPPEQESGGQPATTTTPEQADTGLLSVYAARVQVNKNRMRRSASEDI